MNKCSSVPLTLTEPCSLCSLLFSHSLLLLSLHDQQHCVQLGRTCPTGQGQLVG